MEQIQKPRERKKFRIFLLKIHFETQIKEKNQNNRVIKD